MVELLAELARDMAASDPFKQVCTDLHHIAVSELVSAMDGMLYSHNCQKKCENFYGDGVEEVRAGIT